MTIIKSVCKSNRYYDDSDAISEFKHLRIGECYDFAFDGGDSCYLIVDGDLKIGIGYAFFTRYPVFDCHDFYQFFMNESELREFKITQIINFV